VTYKNVENFSLICLNVLVILEVKLDGHCFTSSMTLSFFAYWVPEQPSMCGNFSVTAVMREIQKISFRRKFVSRITKVPWKSNVFQTLIL